jgi:ATP phosphoribosyltransferase
MTARDRLRIAVQKNGRLAEPSLDVLAKCGLKFRTSRDKLFCYGETLAVDLLLVRDDDIPGLICDGVCDLGIVGRNVLTEQSLERAARGADPELAELRPLGFGACRLSIAVPLDRPYDGARDLAGLRIATSYPRLLGRFLAENGVAAQAVILNGSVEIAPRLGTADAICDLVSTGATLAANQLREVAVVARSEAVLAAPRKPPADVRGELLELLLRRLDGVIAVRDSKLVMLHARRDALDAITALLPGNARPSVTPLDGSADEVALTAVCTGVVTWQHLEDMKRAGASGLLVLPVEKMLA